MERIPLQRVANNCGTQMRAEVMDKIVDDYAACLDSLPPVTVFYDGSRYILADGFHRLAAHIRAGAADIACEVKAGTLRDAILYAAGANAAHGHRRTNADKRRAIDTLLRDEEWRAKSDRWIADVVKVHHATVASLREELYPAKQLDNYPVDNATHPRRVQSQDGKTRTVPQRPAKPPEPAPEPVPVVTEEPIAAPRFVRTQPRRMPLQAVREKVNVFVVQLIDIRDDIINGLIEGDDMELAHAASSIDLAILHLSGQTTGEGGNDAGR
jgi:hypothetical protein